MADFTPPKLTAIDRLVIHGVGFVATARIHDDRLDLVVDRLRRAVAAMEDRPHTEKLRLAALGICETYRRRRVAGGSMDWAIACMDASAAAQAFHWQAFCMLDGA